MLLDWEAAAANDPFYDLAAISVFARMDEPTCERLLAAHDGEAVVRLPARFIYTRRLVAVLAAAMFLSMAVEVGTLAQLAVRPSNPRRRSVTSINEYVRAG